MKLNGPGKYDSAAKKAMEATQAQGVVLMVFGGWLGSGIAVKLPEHHLRMLPIALRTLADELERDLNAPGS